MNNNSYLHQLSPFINSKYYQVLLNKKNYYKFTNSRDQRGIFREQGVAHEMRPIQGIFKIFIIENTNLSYSSRLKLI